MEVITIESQAFKQIQNQIDKIQKDLQDIKDGKVNDEYLNTEQALKFLKVQSKKTLYNLRQRGKITFTSVGGKILYPKSDLVKYLEDNKIKDLTSY